jgi:glucoamylase
MEVPRKRTPTGSKGGVRVAGDPDRGKENRLRWGVFVMSEKKNGNAPGGPGIPPKWTSSAKVGVGTALNNESQVWFTLSHGIFNEIYYPRVDHACCRDMGMVVTDGRDFFSEEKRHASHEVSFLSEGVPAYRLVNRCFRNRYRIEKEVVTDPWRDTVLQRTHFIPLEGSLESYHLYVILAPHLANRGAGNSAWAGDYKGVPMFFARRENSALALACSVTWKKQSVGYVGSSDGWQDLKEHRCMRWSYRRAENGNVAITGEIDLKASGGRFVLAVGFGSGPAEAGHRALASLLDGFDRARREYVRGWERWQRDLKCHEPDKECGRRLYRISTAMLRAHESKHIPGGLIASLSIPWGSSRGDDDLGGYHLVWPRDLVEAAGGLLAAGAGKEISRILRYLQAAQEADGHWPQNMWLDGREFWTGVQMDETAFPILLTDLARRKRALSADAERRFWPMVKRAAGYLVRNGPVTQEDRWEEDPGYSPFTLAVEVAALLAAADFAGRAGEKKAARYLRDTADAWNDSIERWTYVTGTDWARSIGVEGYYVRIAPPETADAASPVGGFVPIKNRPPGQSSAPAVHMVSPDALALVRFGLRAPDDPRIVNTVKVIDAVLKVETPHGPAWRRYNGDGCGEHEDGSSFDGTGIGRPWPLLTGERAHYELAAGRLKKARELMETMERFAGEGEMMPEQVWDAEDIPEKELFRGEPTGSAMPLVWAHGEYVKLCRSLKDGRIFDMPTQTVKRYLKKKSRPRYSIWSFNQKRKTVPAGKSLRLDTLAPAMVRWSPDGWSSFHEVETKDTGLGVYSAEIPAKKMRRGTALHFTFYWPEAGRWEGRNYTVEVKPDGETDRL